MKISQFQFKFHWSLFLKKVLKYVRLFEFQCSQVLKMSWNMYACYDFDGLKYATINYEKARLLNI